MKNILLVLGNGFSIDLIKHLQKNGGNASHLVDLSNLFTKGTNVRWPGDSSPGFLSFRRCPNLWSLGARPHLDATQSYRIIQDIITSANASVESGKFIPIVNRPDASSLYLKAYIELTHYLKYLFVDYDTKVKDLINSDSLKDWEWAKILKHLASSESIGRVSIVTYNYDVMLERVLEILDIEYDTRGMGNDGRKFMIFKPHGSISFIHNIEVLEGAYQIDLTNRPDSGSIDEFKLDMEGMSIAKTRHAILPPAGQAEGYDQNWATTINQALYAELNSNQYTNLIICGISYWHVDRKEINIILAKINDECEVHLIDPWPSGELIAVLTTFFAKLVVHTDALVIRECV